MRSLHFCSVFCRAITALQLAYDCGCRSHVLYEGMDFSIFSSEHVTLHFPSVPPKFRGPMRLFSVSWDHLSLSLVPMAACLPFLRTSVNQFSALERIRKRCLFSMALGCGQWQSFVGSQLPPAPLVGSSVGADKPTWWLCHPFLSDAYSLEKHRSPYRLPLASAASPPRDLGPSGHTRPSSIYGY